MIIGIDATAFSHPQPGGYKTYVTNLLAALRDTPSQHTFRIFLDREVSPIERLAVPEGNGIVVSNCVPALRQVIREQIQLPRQATRERCSVVHYTANTAPSYSRTPFVLTLHDTIALTGPQAPFALSHRRLWQWMLGQYARYVIPSAARNCQALITVSDFEKRQIVRYLKLPSEKIHSIHLAPASLFHPFDQSKREAANEQVISTYGFGQRFILAVGHEQRKNVSSVLRAYGRLKIPLRKQTGLLIVCARQPARRSLQDEVARLQLGDTVRVIGGVKPEDLLHMYNGAAALVFPSLRESFGLPPLEAMACGTPVIASTASSLPEVLGDAALLVPPMDLTALTSAIERVLDDSYLAASLTDRGIARCKQFSWERTAMKTLAVYESVCAW